MKTPLVNIVSKQPPGGRCSLYTDYARILKKQLNLNYILTHSEDADAHGHGFPSLIINKMAIQPADGVILMPEDVMAALLTHGIFIPEPAHLLEALNVPLNRLLNDAG